MKSATRRMGLAVAALGLLVGAAGQARAGLAFTLSNTTGLNLGNPPFTLGFQFTTNQSIVVTQLGLFDDSQNGLAESHAIGLWNSSGTLLASTTIDSGTTDPLTNQFRVKGITGVTLAAGQSYTVGALYSTGDDALIFPGQATGFATAPEINFVNAGFASGSLLSNPTASGGTDPAYFGPNFTFNASAVPEPATMIPGGMAGLLGLGYAWRRRKAKPAA